jgi:hypothetical protein
MNIFVLDANPITAARFHNDRHVCKMILESCQLMATAHYMFDRRIPGGLALRPSHGGHPCARWVRSGPVAYGWLHALCGALLVEYRARTGAAHSYAGQWEALYYTPRGMPWAATMPVHPICMPDACKVYVPTGENSYLDPVESYRRFYFREKKHIASWYNGDENKVPQWWREMEQDSGHVAIEVAHAVP